QAVLAGSQTSGRVGPDQPCASATSASPDLTSSTRTATHPPPTFGRAALKATANSLSIVAFSCEEATSSWSQPGEALMRAVPVARPAVRTMAKASVAASCARVENPAFTGVGVYSPLAAVPGRPYGVIRSCFEGGS